MLILWVLISYRISMKTNKKSLLNQRKLLERKIEQWLPLRSDRKPPSGWLKAIRGSLGISARQLAKRLGSEHASIIQFEKREAQGKVTLETIEKLARAMNCTLVYAVIPNEKFNSLNSIIDEQAKQAARKIVSKVDHTMRLEQQGLSLERLEDQVNELAAELKSKMDPSLWSTK